MNTIYNIFDFGAIGDGLELDSDSIQKAIDECHVNGGGQVIIPAGNYSVGSLELKSFVELHLMNGAKLIATSNSSHYKNKSIIYAKNADHIAVTGFGIIDGNHMEFVEEDIQYHMSGKQFRPKIIFLKNCINIVITDITIQNAPQWTVHPLGCENILIKNINIFNDLKMANCDGIDPDHCKNVRIDGCTIHCADDCIVFKNTEAGREFGSCRDITVTGCNLISTSCAVKFGSETIDLFKNIIISDCIITASNRALGIQLRDEGSVENVIFQNITIETRRFYDRYWGRAEPIWITNIPRSNKTKTGHIKNITFQNIIAECENGVFIQGTKQGDILNIRIENLKLKINKKSKWEGGIYDRRPSQTDPFIFGKTDGLRIENAHLIHLKDIQIIWGENVQSYYCSALRCNSVTGLRLENFKGIGAHMDDDSIILINTEIDQKGKLNN